MALSQANCINALGKRKKKGLVFVPFRNSKLTRLLKDGLCGNSRQVARGAACSSRSGANLSSDRSPLPLQDPDDCLCLQRQWAIRAHCQHAKVRQPGQGDQDARPPE